MFHVFWIIYDRSCSLNSASQWGCWVWLISNNRFHASGYFRNCFGLSVWLLLLFVSIFSWLFVDDWIFTYYGFFPDWGGFCRRRLYYTLGCFGCFICFCRITRRSTFSLILEQFRKASTKNKFKNFTLTL